MNPHDHAPVAQAGRRDPRSRAVIAANRLPSGSTEFHLECGHIVRRKLKFCQPSRMICTECGKAGR